MSENTAMFAPSPSASVKIAGERETRCSIELPNGETHIMRHIIQPVNSIAQAEALSYSRRIAESSVSPALRFCL